MKPTRLHRNYTGFAIALAWPATFCKQAGAWYDPLMRVLGFNRKFYYRAGHAAVVLVDGRNGACHYFDFGRYHAPFAHARVRSAATDHELTVHATARISADRTHIENLQDILEELQQNVSCHGSGTLHASYTFINYDAAISKAISMQKASPLPYGPFVYGGSNCSRFVRTVILAGKPGITDRIALSIMLPFTPTPMSNVMALPNTTQQKKRINGSKIVSPELDKYFLNATLPPPAKPISIPDKAFWLSGEGAGSWFEIDFIDGKALLNRYAPDGTSECSGIFENNDLSLTLRDSKDIDHEIIHPSHCQRITILMSGKMYVLERVEKRATHEQQHH